MAKNGKPMGMGAGVLVVSTAAEMERRLGLNRSTLVNTARLSGLPGIPGLLAHITGCEVHPLDGHVIALRPDQLVGVPPEKEIVIPIDEASSDIRETAAQIADRLPPEQVIALAHHLLGQVIEQS